MRVKKWLVALLVLGSVSVAYAAWEYERGIAMIKRGIAEGARDSMVQAKQDAGIQRYDYADTIGDIEELDCGQCPNYPTCETLRQRAVWDGQDGEVDWVIGLGKQIASDQDWAAGNLQVGAGDVDVAAQKYAAAEQHFKDAQPLYDSSKTEGAPDTGAEAEFVRTFIHYRDANQNIQDVMSCEVCYGD